MNVTIIGAGNVGRGIGHQPVAGGHDVTVVDRDPEELRDAAEGGATVEAAGPGAELRGEVVRHEDRQIELLMVACSGEQALPVFSGEGEAEMFVWLEGAFEDGWRVRETSAGELVSILYGPCAV